MTLTAILHQAKEWMRFPAERDEFHLAAAAQNLRKLAKMIPMPAPKSA